MEDLRTVKASAMRPLNWSARLSKECTDIMFSMAVNDVESVLSRIRSARKALDALETEVKKTVSTQTKGKSKE
jgi:hypothetical protein